MRRISGSTPIAFFTLLLLATALPAQTTDAASPSAGVSKIRIVRLSEVKGAVQLDRNNGRGFEAAMANLPVVEQSRLRTEEGVAEVEFEDNSTLRLAPNSEVEFPQLERLASGQTLSSVHLVKGMAYVSLVKTRGNQFNLLFGQQKLELEPSTHVRLQMSDAEAKLAVLDGAVRVDGQDVAKKKTVTFPLQNENKPAIAKDIAPGEFDSWDKESSEYHSRTVAYNSLNSSPYTYGQNDMMYYGNFMDAGGCGMMWRPYFASAAWDPYANGAWAWYQGAGYSWVSPYPWGWTPYHYGSWSFCPGTGWGWMPGGMWSGLGNSALIAANPTGGSGRPPLAPIHPPRVGEPTMLGVNTKPLVRSDVASPDSFVFRRDSAGMGIPRDTLGKLDKFSHQAIEKGTARADIYMTAPTPAMVNGRPTSMAMAPPTIHRGSAPASSVEQNMSASRGPGRSESQPTATSVSNAHQTSAPAGHR